MIILKVLVTAMILAIAITTAIVMIVLSGWFIVDKIDKHNKDAYFLENRGRINLKIDYYFDKFYVSDLYRDRIKREITENIDSIYMNKDSLDKYIENKVYFKYNKILYKMLAYDKYRYSKSNKKYMNINDIDKSDRFDFLGDALYDKNYKYRKFLIDNIIAVGSIIKQPVKSIDKVDKDDGIPDEEKKEIIGIIEDRVLKALNKFHDIFAELDRLYDEEVRIQPSILEENLFDEIDRYNEAVSKTKSKI